MAKILTDPGGVDLFGTVAGCFFAELELEEVVPWRRRYPSPGRQDNYLGGREVGRRSESRSSWLKVGGVFLYVESVLIPMWVTAGDVGVLTPRVVGKVEPELGLVDERALLIHVVTALLGIAVLNARDEGVEPPEDGVVES